MRPKINVIVFTIVFCAAILVASGCALNKINLLDNGTVLLERVPTKDVYVASAHVFQDDSEMVICGKVKRDISSGAIRLGHVDMAIFAPDGAIIKQLSVSDSPVSSGKSRFRDSSFTVRLPFVPSTGTKVRLAYHRVTESAESTFDCGENQALGIGHQASGKNL